MTNRNNKIPQRIYIKDYQLVQCEVDGIADARINSHQFRSGNGNLEEYLHLDSLWHDASEEPRKGEKLLGFDVDGFSTYRWIDQEPTWKEFVYETVLQRWLYISDLIPKGGEQ